MQDDGKADSYEELANAPPTDGNVPPEQRPSPDWGAWRRYPVGSEVMEGGVHVRVWAPKCFRVDWVPLERSSTPAQSSGEAERRLEPEGNGYFSLWIPAVAAGTHYGFRLDGGERWYPDPASRFQPLGPDGPSQVISAADFRWSAAEQDWHGVSPTGHVIYELHVGTFTPEGTWAAAAQHLAELARFGITLIEVMPVADFAGNFGWGYDGVNLFAPTRLYGVPDDFRRFVEHAHELGLGVILDVVYNHFGPLGNYLPQFSLHYLTDRHANEWGAAINFDDSDSAPVRDYFLSNVRYWIDEFHLDGYRFDATQAIIDNSPQHILTELTRAAREAAGERNIYLSVENHTHDRRNHLSCEDGGFDMDAVWNDDFHHAARVRATGRREGYYSDYRGSAAEFLALLRQGILFQGQVVREGRLRRGSPIRGIPPTSLVAFLQNHDQVANSSRGRRLHQETSPSLWRALTALWLLSPQTPLFLQGQEFAASSPFLYFADMGAELGRLVTAGRLQFLHQFPSLASMEMQAAIPDPCLRETFLACKLDWEQKAQHHEAYRFHQDLLELRRDDAVLCQLNGTAARRDWLKQVESLSARSADPSRRAGRKRHAVQSMDRPVELDGNLLSADALVLRFWERSGNDRLLLINLGPDLDYTPCAEPLLATEAGVQWDLLWHSESPAYGGRGIPPWETNEGWHLAAESVVLLRALHKS